jgi:hypothetical protein
MRDRLAEIKARRLPCRPCDQGLEGDCTCLGWVEHAPADIDWLVGEVDRLRELLDKPIGFVESRAIDDPVQREAAARRGVAACRTVRAEALRELHRKLGSWAKVGEAVGLPRQDCWRMAKG